MSRAFVKEDDGVEDLPEKLISEHRNLVTEAGYQQISSEVQRLDEALADAQRSGDRDTIQRISRDLRYWSQRLQTAELQSAPKSPRSVVFGASVKIERRDGRVQTFRIVGEDEADPKLGSISYVSPLAQALIGKSVGDDVRAGATEAEIIAID